MKILGEGRSSGIVTNFERIANPFLTRIWSTQCVHYHNQDSGEQSMKALKRRWLGVLIAGIVLPAVAPPMALADDMNRRIEDRMTLKEQRVDLECGKQSVMKGVYGEVLFAIEECPVCYPGDLQLRETRRQGDSRKGTLSYAFTCRTVSTDYYAGKRKKVIEEEQSGAVTADYIYAFDELSIANITVSGPAACAAPIVRKLKTISDGASQTNDSGAYSSNCQRTSR
jgi:hypothetical protein